MEIIHVCNNYVGTKVHLNQVKSLQKINPSCKQHVIIPVYDKSHCSINNIEITGVTLYYEVFNVRFIKYLPFLKLLYVTLFLLIKYRKLLSNADFLYSHTIWTNGLLCYLSNKLFRVNYIVAARSNDYHTFLRRLPHYRFVVRKIVTSAQSVIFISDIYKKCFFRKYPKIFKGCNSEVIYNGIDDFWVEKSKSLLAKKMGKKSEILFVGRFNKTKNISQVVKAVNLAREVESNLELKIVGGSREELLKLLNINELPSWLVVEGKVNKERLFELYSSCACLLVPSIQETFGLVYLEALSCGCPVIHSKNEAIDGIFAEEPNVISVEPNDLDNITNAILTCIDMPFSFDRTVIPAIFSWDSFANKTLKIISR